jgi:hypothetical protein
MKKTILLAVTFGFVLLAFTQVHAALTWSDNIYQFRYEVLTNSSDVYTDNTGNAAQRVKGPTPVITNPAPVDSGVSSTSGTDNTGLGMVLKAGAGGSHLGDGLKVHAYAEISTTSGGVLSPYGVDSENVKTQHVTALNHRDFRVDTPERYNLTAQLTGSINDPEFHATDFLKADYNWQGGVILQENIYGEDGLIIQENVIMNITLDQLITGDEIQFVSLRTDDGNGHDVNYSLESMIDIDSTLFNFFEPLGGRQGDITAADIGFLGTEAVPLDIEATITVAPVPIPGAAILLLSGITVIVGIGNRKKKV